MHCEGMFFLCRRPMPVPASGTPQKWLLPVLERNGQGVTHVTAWWAGDDARAFMERHHDALRPGCALRLRIDRIEARAIAAGAELRGHITHAELAPARWASRDEATSSQPQPSAA